MKNIFKDFYGRFNKSPVIPTIAIAGLVCLVSLAVITISRSPERKAADKMTALRLAAISSPETITTSVPEISPDSAITETSPIQFIPEDLNKETYRNSGFNITYHESTSVSGTTTALNTETITTSSAERTTTNTPHSYDYSYISAGDSPNSSFYQDRLTVIGDSIASGFNAYGYIPYEHNIAQGSLSLWNMDSFTFDVGGYYMGLLDAADTVNSPLYYVSIGMNDIYAYTSYDYASAMVNLVQQILERVPTATIVVGAITPVSEYNYYTDNASIREFNYALQTSIENIGSNQILFFDAYSVLADPYTLALSYDNSGGDGLHLSGSSYEYVLKCLFNFLDSTDVKSQIDIHDTTGY